MATAAPINPLEYASRDTLPPRWGPFFFRPSRLTLVLTLLTAAAATWLALRHDPWRLVCSFPTPRGELHFTRSGDLLVYSPGVDASLYDSATGRLIRRTPLDFVGRYDQVGLPEGGEQILFLPAFAKSATQIDLRTGARQELPLPVKRQNVELIAPSPPRVLAWVDETHFDRSMELHPLLPAGAATTRPALVSTDAYSTTFSPDGRRLLLWDPRGGSAGDRATAKLTLVDGHTGAPVGETIEGAGLSPPGDYFVGPNWLLVQRDSGTPTAVSVDLYSTETGRRVHSLTFPTAGASPSRWRIFGTGNFAVSDDGSLVARFTPWAIKTLEVLDAASGARLLSRPTELMAGRPVFVPGTHHLVDVLPTTPGRLAVIDPAHPQPLAILPLPRAASPAAGSPVVRRDGQMIAVLNGWPTPMTTVYGKAAWDCRESRFGALAFPQTWITAALYVAWVLSASRDARRARDPADAHRPSLLVTVGLPAVAAPLTLLVLLAACLGRLTLSPAPLLLLAAIGLATHSRFWRLATLVLLCGAFAWCAYLLVRFRRVGLTGDPIPWTPLDRTYAVPHAIPTTAFALATLLAALAIVLLTARSRRAA